MLLRSSSDVCAREEQNPKGRQDSVRSRSLLLFLGIVGGEGGRKNKAEEGDGAKEQEEARGRGAKRRENGEGKGREEGKWDGMGGKGEE